MAEMRPGIDRIQLNGLLRKLKRRFRLVAIAEDPRMNEMLDVVHLYEAAVARREGWIFPDGIAKDGDRALPAFGIEFEHQTLAAKPTVVNIQRDVRLARQPHQPFGR